MQSQKSYHQQMIEEFMIGAKQEVPNKPIIPNEDVRLLRARLILEEAVETINALGFTLSDIESCELIPNVEPNLVMIADGCADISVVTIGTLSACGIPDIPVLREVDKNNLKKIENGSINKYGKLVKPANHIGPDLVSIIERLQNANS